MIRHRPLEKRGEKEKRKERIGRRKRREESEKGGGQGEAEGHGQRFTKNMAPPVWENRKSASTVFVYLVHENDTWNLSKRDLSRA